MRVGALRSALSMKLKEGHLLILEAFDMPEVKPRKLERELEKLKADSGAVIVDEVDNQTLRLSARNMNDHLFLPTEGVNLYDLLRHEHLVLTKKAVAALEQRCSGRASLDAPLEK